MLRIPCKDRTTLSAVVSLRASRSIAQVPDSRGHCQRESSVQASPKTTTLQMFEPDKSVLQTSMQAAHRRADPRLVEATLAFDIWEDIYISVLHTGPHHNGPANWVHKALRNPCREKHRTEAFNFDNTRVPFGRAARRRSQPLNRLAIVASASIVAAILAITIQASAQGGPSPPFSP